MAYCVVCANNWRCSRGLVLPLVLPHDLAAGQRGGSHISGPRLKCQQERSAPRNHRPIKSRRDQDNHETAKLGIPSCCGTIFEASFQQFGCVGLPGVFSTDFVVPGQPEELDTQGNWQWRRLTENICRHRPKLVGAGNVGI